MTTAPFRYPGGKALQADWIVKHIPEHDCYVEPFGGAGSVLFTKPISTNEIYNDIDSHVVNFFDVLKDNYEELVTRLERLGFARELHNRWKKQLYGDDELPEDDIERAVRFFYLRYTQFAALHNGEQGFQATRHRNAARVFSCAVDELEDFSARLRNAVIEHQDYRDLISQYDGPGTAFYCDPPYAEGVCTYQHGSEFDHDELAELLAGIDGMFILSCVDVPPLFLDSDGYWFDSTEAGRRMGSHHAPKLNTEDEVLVMNFDPEQTASFTGANQSTIETYAER